MSLTFLFKKEKKRKTLSDGCVLELARSTQKKCLLTALRFFMLRFLRFIETDCCPNLSRRG